MTSPRRAFCAAFAVLTLILAPAIVAAPARAGDSDDDNHMCGCGSQCGCGDSCGCADSSIVGPPRPAGYTGFTSHNVVLLGRVSLFDMDGARSSGNDCWGYVSPSGREYALMGANNALVFIEITDPRNPVVVASVPHPSSLWADVKVYQQYAYVVNENNSGGGVQVIDMSNIDNGVVNLVTNVTFGGSLRRTHNVALNEQSGYLYLCGANWPTNGLVAISLANPAAPVLAGSYSSVYVHDAHVVTYTDGPYAGREIAFCFVGSTGIDIVDVTNKSNMFRISRTTYSGLSYSHQGWVDMDRQLLFMDDELDEGSTVNVTTTRVFNVANLSSPQYLGWFTSGVEAIDHNQYVHEGFVYQANYRSGLRIFDTRTNPVNPPQTGWLDTYPESNSAHFNGAWSTYPFFPSGNVIVSDLEGGLFIVDPTFARSGGVPLSITIPGGAPGNVPASGGTMQVLIQGQNGFTLEPGSAELVVRAGGNEAIAPLIDLGGGVFRADFPNLACVGAVEYLVRARASNGLTVNEPIHAPTIMHAAGVAAPLLDRSRAAAHRNAPPGSSGFICPVVGDINADGVVNFEDFSDLLSAYGQSGAPGSIPADVNNDGVVDFADFSIILANYGQTAW